MAARWRYATIAGLSLFLTVSCASPPTIERAGVEYDRAVANTIMEQLLLNVARARFHHPIHFTVISNVAATFDFRFNAGVGHSIESATGMTLIPIAGATVAENPTVSIVPVEGEEFTKRLLTPLDETKFYFLFRQGIDLGSLLRLMAREFQVSGGHEDRGFANDPEKAEGYKEFRRRVLHLSALNEARQLHIEPMVFEQAWELPLHSPEAFQALEKGYHVSYNSDAKTYQLRRQVSGRIVITNYNPAILSNEVRYHLHTEASKLPPNQILVDLRPGYPGGDYAFRGSFKLRSFNAILLFLAAGITEQQEFNVEKDGRSGSVRFNPAKTLEILEAEKATLSGAFKVGYNGRIFAIAGDQTDNPRETRWNLETFRLLYQLFQMTVTDVSKTLVPAITIAK